MAQKITMVLQNGDKVIESISKETETSTSQLLTSLKDFQMLVNATLTNLIVSGGESIEVQKNEDDEESSEDELQVSPKKKKI